MLGIINIFGKGRNEENGQRDYEKLVENAQDGNFYDKIADTVIKLYKGLGLRKKDKNGDIGKSLSDVAFNIASTLKTVECYIGADMYYEAACACGAPGALYGAMAAKKLKLDDTANMFLGLCKIFASGISKVPESGESHTTPEASDESKVPESGEPNTGKPKVSNKSNVSGGGTYTISELLNGKTKEGKKLPKKVMNKRKDLLEELYTGFFEDFDGDFYKMDIHKKLGIEKCTGHDRFYEPYGIVIDGNGNIENLYTLRAVSSIANMYDNEIRETEKNNLSDGKEKELADGLKNHNEHQTTEIKMINGKEYTTGYMKHRNTMVPIAIPCEKRKDGDTNIEEIIVGEIGGKYMKTDIEGVEKTLDDYVNKISNISK